MMIVMALLRFTTNTISIPELMEESLTRLAGGQVEAFFINALGVGGKALLLVTIIEGTLLLGGLLGFLYARYWPFNDAADNGRWFSGILYGVAISLFLNLIFLPLVGQGMFGAESVGATAPPEIARALYGQDLAPFGLPVFISMLVLSLVFGLTLAALLPWGQAAGSAAAPTTDGSVLGRRDFMRKSVGGVALALAGGIGLWALIRAALQPPPLPELVEAPLDTAQGGSAGGSPTSEVANPGHEAEPDATPPMDEVPTTPPVPDGFEGVKPLLVPEITPVASFYITTKNFVDPTVDGASWRLTFKGLVDAGYSLSLKDLMDMPVVTVNQTLACISNPVGGSLIGNATWKGVDFATLLRKAGPKSGAVDVITRAVDGYADSIPLDIALNSGCVLAYEMNGQPLVQKHGFPARLLVPNIYGMKNCKWINEVELVNYDFMGYWEAQGWSDTAVYQTMSRIDYPDKNSIPAKPIYIGGVAFAGSRGIKRVEVSTDGGKNWRDAQLRPPMGKNTWVQWIYPWIPEPGTYSLQVRATDGTGAVQAAEETDTYPNGATGYSTRQVRVS
jgi:DMSO/TMAO reductase YedYZ molybdopterin-dependent catalytic subunit